MSERLFDVVAVNLGTLAVRLIAERRTYVAAEAIVSHAVYRRGVDTEFFAEVPTGTYAEGDRWRGMPEPQP